VFSIFLALEPYFYLIDSFFCCSFFTDRNAYAIALFLENHAAVGRVLYPGLPSHPQHDIAKKQQHGFGAMITFYCKGGLKQASIFLENVSSRALP